MIGQEEKQPVLSQIIVSASRRVRRDTPPPDPYIEVDGVVVYKCNAGVSLISDNFECDIHP